MDQNKLKAALEELKALRKPIHNINAKHKESLSKLEKIAVNVTDSVGSVGFFMVIFTLDFIMVGLEYHRIR